MTGSGPARVRRALRRLDELPAGVAVGLGIAIGGAQGLALLTHVVPWTVGVFFGLAVLMVPLALSGRPVVALDAEGEAAQRRGKAWRIALATAVVAVFGVAEVWLAFRWKPSEEPEVLGPALAEIRMILAAQIPLTGFTTSPCTGSLVISQVYAGGGSAAARYKYDFVELYNRGETVIELAGKSLQYASAKSTVWNSRTVLSGAVQPGAYFLVQLASDGSVGSNLPAPDGMGVTNMSTINGKVALISSAVQMPDGRCPPEAITIDFVGYGSADCKEGVRAVKPLSRTTAAVRAQSGCQDRNNNEVDFSVSPPAPRNSASPMSACACAARNE